jgi:hypothetical protein
MLACPRPGAEPGVAVAFTASVAVPRAIRSKLVVPRRCALDSGYPGYGPRAVSGVSGGDHSGPRASGHAADERACAASGVFSNVLLGVLGVDCCRTQVAVARPMTRSDTARAASHPPLDPIRRGLRSPECCWSEPVDTWGVGYEPADQDLAGGNLTPATRRQSTRTCGSPGHRPAASRNPGGIARLPAPDQPPVTNLMPEQSYADHNRRGERRVGVAGLGRFTVTWRGPGLGGATAPSR